MRLSFDIPDEQGQIISRLVPHGMRKSTYETVILAFVRALEENPSAILHALVDGKMNISIGNSAHGSDQ